MLAVTREDSAVTIVSTSINVDPDEWDKAMESIPDWSDWDYFFEDRCHIWIFYV